MEAVCAEAIFDGASPADWTNKCPACVIKDEPKGTSLKNVEPLCSEKTPPDVLPFGGKMEPLGKDTGTFLPEKVKA